MDSGFEGTLREHSDLPSFENDLNKTSPHSGQSGGQGGMAVTEPDRPTGSMSESDSQQNINITPAGVMPSPGSGQVSDGSEFPCDFNGDLPGYILYLHDKNMKLQMFKTYAELSEYLVDATSAGTRRSRESDLVAAEILNTPLCHVAHHTTMGEYLRYLYANDQLTDVHVDVNGEIFMAHRIALSCYSNYLADLFYKSKRRRLPFDLKINGISAESFAAFLEFVYTGEITIAPVIAADLLLIADFLRVKGLQKRRAEILDNLPLEQTIKLVARSRKSLSNQAMGQFSEQMLELFSEAVKSKYFFELDVDTLCQLLSSDDLVVTSEFEVYRVVVDWLLFDLADRAKFTDRLLNLVRFCHMTEEELFMCVEMTGMVNESSCRRSLITEANWILTARRLGRVEPLKLQVPPPRKYSKHGALFAPKTPPPNYNIVKAFPAPPQTPTNRQQFIPPPLMTSTPVTSPRKRLASKPVAKPVLLPSKLQTMSSPIPKSVDILVIGGFQNDNESMSSQGSSPKDQWVHYCQLPEPLQNHAVSLLSGKLYITGGSSANEGADQTPTKHVFAMDIQDKKWKQVADMNDARLNHCACALGGKVYAAGGRGLNDRLLSSVECYTPFADTWTHVASLKVPRCAAAAACTGGRMFVVGGLGATARESLPVLSDVEIYDPGANRWTKKQGLRIPRCNSSLVTVGERMFLVGGATKDLISSLLTSVAAIDEYEPREDRWYHVTNMKVPRHDAGVAVAGFRIYIIGGVSTSINSVLQSIECYDSRACAWLSGLKDLPVPSRHICCASVVSEWRKVNTSENNSN